MRALLRCIFALGFAFCATVTPRALELEQPLLDQTVPLGTNVSFDVRFRSESRVAIQWQHDGILIRDQTNTTLAINGLKPTDIGRYTVILSAGASRLTNSAVLDIDVPYPPARITRAAPTFVRVPPSSIEFSTVLGHFAGGNVATAEGSSQGYPSSGWTLGYYGIAATNGSRLWKGFGTSLAGTVLPFYISSAIVDNSLISGHVVFRDYSTIPDEYVGEYISLSASGETNWIWQLRGFTPSFSVDEYQYLHFYSQSVSIDLRNARSAVATVVDKSGSALFARSLPYGLSSAGRFFAGQPGTTNLLPEFNYAARSTTSIVYGALSWRGDLEWVSQTEPAGGYFQAIPAGPTVGEGAMLVITNIPNNSSPCGIAKLLKSGDTAWSVQIRGRSGGLQPQDIHLNKASQVLAFVLNTNEISIGDVKLAADQEAPFVYFQIDAAGKVRSACRLKCRGLQPDPYIPLNLGPDKETRQFNYIAPGRYGTAMLMGGNAEIGDFVFTSTTNRWHIAEVSLPDPNPYAAAVPETSVILTNGASITLSASPDVPGFVLYRWFRDGIAIPNENSSNLSIETFSFANAGRYSVHIRNAFGSVTNAISTVNYSGPMMLAVDLRENGDSIVLRWPLSPGEYVLEQTSSLLQLFAPTSATVVTNTALGRREATVTGGSAQAYYRLRPQE